MTPAGRRAVSPTAQVVAALALGLVLGIAASHTQSAAVVATIDALATIGVLWVNAIRMTVVPLVVALLIVGVARSDTAVVGRLGLRAGLLFVALLAASAAYAIVVVPPVMRGLRLDAGATAALRASVAAGTSQTAAQLRELPGFATWLVGLVPANPIRAAADGALLPLVIFTLLFAVAIARIDVERRQSVLRLFEGLADAMLVLIRWIIALAPIGVFALVVPTAARLGVAMAGALGYYAVALVLLCVGFMALLYPLTAVAARLPLGRLARAALPAQAVAVATSSSLASLPALIEGAERVLAVPPAVSGFVLPLAVSSFKISSPIVKLTGALFLARLYGVDLGVPQLLSLVAIAILLSFSTPGVPHGWLLVLAPALASVGVPPDGVGLLIAVDTLPDLAATTLNVTGDLAVAAILGKARQGAADVPPALSAQ
ncbi:MAG: dicarboxylate/amino acid:cation symporter [Gemmatimonadota bacterium]|nr:dicarboxylate/amino acid:cation symporter [Gemmatimonadota bacterium]